jgi:ankyrin repeat protein
MAAAEIISTHIPFADNVCMLCAERLSGTELDLYPCAMICGHAILCHLCGHSSLKRKGANCLQCGQWTAWSSRADIRVNFDMKVKLAMFNSAVVADIVVVPSTLSVPVTSPTFLGTTPTAVGVEEDHVDGEWAVSVFGDNTLFEQHQSTSMSEIENIVKHLAESKTINEPSGVRMDTEVIRCARNGSLSQMQLLLKYGGDIRMADRDGSTALMNAAQNGRLGLMKLLVRSGAQIDFENKCGHTALMLAARNGHDQELKFMIDEGASVDKRDQLGQTALIFAAMNVHFRCLQVLLDAGANPDIQSKNGDTALIVASRWKSAQCVDLLIRAGTNIDIRNYNLSPFGATDNGKTAIEVTQDKECQFLLSERSAHLKKSRTSKRAFWRS